MTPKRWPFLARAASQGVFWPPWHAMVHAGSAFLMPHPIDLLSAHLFGPLNALRLDAPAHVLRAMCGASLLASAVASTRPSGERHAWPRCATTIP